ncbi:tRNA pseudouridine(38-40) synthase TruA [Cryptosporangium sp. NPDC048952]|uniref:tRNA pseudouridine(38-40) synthase TruA n=1 Tax=Cryptosporangium sp. NPDC048952 TaxID=3363961 RepID=UPI0037114B8D
MILIADEPAVPGDAGGGGLVRVRLDLSYDGTDFAGWAIQRGQRTVQGELTEALARVTRTDVALTVAGRTDAGVHAAGQIAHCDLPVEVWETLGPSLVRRLSGVLPGDVRLRAVTRAHPSFDARFGAMRRRYLYRVTDARWGAEPLRRRDTLAWPRELDLETLREAAAGLLGEHDFAAFCRRREGATTIRALQEFRWEVSPEGPGRVLEAHLAADAFCHSMVRSLIGSLLAVGEGRKPASWPASLLTLADRAGGVHVAPPHGLTLMAVEYPPDEELAARIDLTRRVRTLPTS